MKFIELDKEKLGQILLAIPLSSMHEKHQNIKDTLISNNSPSEKNLEEEFLKDLFTLSTDEIADKWYGGRDAIIGFFFKKE